MKKILLSLVLLAGTILIHNNGGQACTLFRLKAQDGTWMLTRSMEFGTDLHYDLVLVPRNKSYTSVIGSGRPGLAWKTALGYIGVACMGMDYGVSEGMNEKGLAVSALWYEPDMVYQSVGPRDSSRALSQTMVLDWILGNFADVSSLRKALSDIRVFKYVDPHLKSAPTLHFAVFDAAGGSIVIEYDNGACNIYDNPLGVMTNAPSFPWQMNNLRQYAGMKTSLAGPLSDSTLTLTSTGHGSGMFGMPGDYTPPSRFVRMSMLTIFADKQPDATSLLNTSQHIINNVAIPFGVIVDRSPSGQILSKESTQWVTFRDLTHLTFYFRTYNNPDLRMIDLKKVNWNATTVVRYPMFAQNQQITNLN